MLGGGVSIRPPTCCWYVVTGSLGGVEGAEVGGVEGAEVGGEEGGLLPVVAGGGVAAVEMIVNNNDVIFLF